MSSRHSCFFIPFLFILFLLLLISPACGGGNLSIFESAPDKADKGDQKKQTDQVAPSEKGKSPAPEVDHPAHPDKNLSTPPPDDDNDEEDNWDDDTVYDDDKSC